jgi:hypothetical protein
MGRIEMTYEGFAAYMYEGYVRQKDIEALQYIENGEYIKGGMQCEDIALAEAVGEEKWNEWAGRLAEELITEQR